jgi:tRNA(Arg) A34 adenosine deaminase TadA
MASETETYNAFMLAAIEEAENAVKEGNHPFGAVLVVGGEIVLRGQNAVNKVEPGDAFADATRHAEMELMSKACRFDNIFLNGYFILEFY